MSKKVGIILSVIFITLFASVLVNAASDPWTSIKDIFQPLLSLLLDVNSGDVAGLLFERFLFALIIVAVVYAVLDNVTLFKNNSFALWAVTISVAVLGVRFIASQDLVETILLSDSVFAVALLSILPFAIYFYFVEDGLNSRVLRRFAWAVYICVFVGLWLTKYSGTDPNKYVLMYMASAVLAVISLILDKTIQREFIKAKMGAKASATNQELEIEIRRRIKQVQEDRTNGIISQAEHDKIIKDLQRRMADIHSAF